MTRNSSLGGRRGAGDAARDARVRLDDFRDEMLAGIKRRIRECLGPQPPDIARYYRAYVRALSGRFEPCRMAEVVRSALSARVVYLGDFHTNPAAQRAEREILEKLARGTRPVVLAVEMFAMEDQEKVDRYLAGSLGEAEFLSSIRYNQSWGFRWDNYRDLLRAASDRGVKVLGLNRKANLKLVERDRQAARLIGEVLKEQPDAVVLVVHGDLHLAPPHLPAEVRRLARGGDRPRVVVYQNSETVYRRLRDEPEGNEVTAVRFDAEHFCLLNTPPLVKMQGYLTWLENSERLLEASGPIRVANASDDPGEFAEEFEALVESLAGFFNLPAPDLESWDVRVLDDVDFVASLGRGNDGPALARLVRERRAVVIPERSIVYLPDTDLVTASGAAIALLSRSASGDPRRGLFRVDAFARRVIDRALEFFAAKLVHPALVGPRPVDLLLLVERSRDGKLPRKLRRRVEVARRLPGWIDALQSGVGLPSEQMARLVGDDRRLAFDLSRTAGEWLGEGIFERYRRGRLAVGAIRGAIVTTWSEPQAFRQVSEWGAAIGD